LPIGQFKRHAPRDAEQSLLVIGVADIKPEGPCGFERPLDAQDDAAQIVNVRLLVVFKPDPPVSYSRLLQYGGEVITTSTDAAGI
jgi:hypothetical protein